MKKLYKFILISVSLCIVNLISLVVTVPADASVIFSDDFNRTDTNTLGPNWTEFYGSLPAGISNNQAYIMTGAGGYWGNFMVFELNLQDQDVAVTFKHQSGDSALFLRTFNNSNTIYIDYYNTNVLQIYEIYQGNYTYITNSAPNAVVGETYTIEAQAIGSNLKVWVNGTKVADATLGHTTSGSAGFGASDGYTKVIFDNFIVTDGIGTPPTPPPVTKTIFIPGFGASWNTNALLNCIPDTDPSHWSLADYAAGIYNPVLSALSGSGWNTIPFYYDWRQQIPINDDKLANKIDENTQDNEKVNVVGHSMGGLIGREYLEASEGGNLNSLLTIGSPHQGSALAYPAWSGGDIWQDNFLAKIAMTLYLKHCGGILSNDRETIQGNIPSVQNLLPTYSYLQQIKTGVPVTPLTAINNWLPTSFSYPPTGVKMETISGTGYDTLKSIPVKEPNKHDISLGNWADGKPAGKIYSTEGDGTVLAESSRIEGVTDTILTQTHSGLVASNEGICKILEFLDTPCPSTSTAFIEPKSALVIIGYPGNFWISDQNGAVKKDKNGVVAFINPKSGNYKLNLIPQTGNTLVVVAQFLPNGQVLYREYNFNGYQPQNKTLKFDLQNPQEDILN